MTGGASGGGGPRGTGGFNGHTLSAAMRLCSSSLEIGGGSGMSSTGAEGCAAPEEEEPAPNEEEVLTGTHTDLLDRALAGTYSFGAETGTDEPLAGPDPFDAETGTEEPLADCSAAGEPAFVGAGTCTEAELEDCAPACTGAEFEPCAPRTATSSCTRVLFWTR